MKCPKCGHRFKRSDLAAELGAKGGRVKSEAKTAAARENAKKGGRPRKQKTEATPTEG